jgi:hypothetical protein
MFFSFASRWVSRRPCFEISVRAAAAIAADQPNYCPEILRKSAMIHVFATGRRHAAPG